jgi:hypothetical protein
LEGEGKHEEVGEKSLERIETVKSEQKGEGAGGWPDVE